MNKTLIVMCVAVLGAACGPATRVVTIPSTTAAVSSKDTATLLVSDSLNFPVVNLLDGDGKVLGQLAGRAHTVIQVPAGHIKLYGVLENRGKTGDRIEGDVEAGKVYYVNCGFRFGGMSMTVLAQRTDADAWKDRKTYETDLPNQQVDQTKLPGLQTDLGDVKPILSKVDERVADFNDDDKKARTILVADGD